MKNLRNSRTEIMKENNPLTENTQHLTTESETNYPEFYRYLDENPVFMNHIVANEIYMLDIDNYLNVWKR